MIDLFSDTKTKPSLGMRQAMMDAEVGDDMSAEDPTVNRLEAMVAEMFGKEAAVYACTATQSNQMGVRTHCRSGDELLIHESGHIANYEAGGPAVLSGVTVRTLSGEWGMLDVPQLAGKIRADDQHLCPTKLVCVENTTNAGGGRAYPLEQLQRVKKWATENDLKVHLDGARLFNAMIARGYSAEDIGRTVDTISICFSKGLGCPMGSIFVGSQEEVASARRSRKLFGGALRQAGVVAATAIYSLENNIERLADDHENAKLFADKICDIDGVMIDPANVETNLVFFEVDPELCDATQLSAVLREQGVKIGAMGSHRLRACTHLDITSEEVVQAADVLRKCVQTDMHATAASSTGPYARG